VRDFPLVILTSDKDIEKVRAIVAVSLTQGTFSDGSTWKPKDRLEVSVYRYEDAPIPKPFELAVCNGGKDLSEQQKDALKKWEDAA
tara:strand:+ start:265 stop:522 length:258 start_codon:yes stop_codon:yes gene_type:complete